jgi:hypothetical protein
VSFDHFLQLVLNNVSVNPWALTAPPYLAFFTVTHISFKKPGHDIFQPPCSSSSGLSSLHGVVYLLFSPAPSRSVVEDDVIFCGKPLQRTETWKDLVFAAVLFSAQGLVLVATVSKAGRAGLNAAKKVAEDDFVRSGMGQGELLELSSSNFC